MHVKGKGLGKREKLESGRSFLRKFLGANHYFFLGIKHLKSVPRIMVYGCFSVSRRSVVRVIHRHEKCILPKLLTHAAGSGGAKFHGGPKLTANLLAGASPR